MNWRRVCSACEQSDPITKKEAQSAAVENDEWPKYINAVKVPAFLGLGILLAVIGALFLFLTVVSNQSQVYRAEDTDPSTLSGGSWVTVDTLYLLDYYGYETDADTDDVTGYFFLAYYYATGDAVPCFVSLHVEEDDDLFGTVQKAMDADGTYTGNLRGPAYCSISDFDKTMESYYKESMATISESSELTDVGVNLEYYAQKEEKGSGSLLIVSALFLLPGLALIVGYCCKANPKRPPKIKTKQTDE